VAQGGVRHGWIAAAARYRDSAGRGSGSRRTTRSRRTRRDTWRPLTPKRREGAARAHANTRTHIQDTWVAPRCTPTCKHAGSTWCARVFACGRAGARERDERWGSVTVDCRWGHVCSAVSRAQCPVRVCCVPRPGVTRTPSPWRNACGASSGLNMARSPRVLGYRVAVWIVTRMTRIGPLQAEEGRRRLVGEGYSESCS
jgi:hypothetical protein